MRALSVQGRGSLHSRLQWDSAQVRLLRALLGYLLTPLLALAANPQHASAQAYEHTCHGRGTVDLTVAFVNGMLTTQPEAENALHALATLARDELERGLGSFEVQLLYNQRQGVLQDLWEALKQRLAISPPDFVRLLLGAPPREGSPEIPPEFDDAVLQFALDLADEGTLHDRDLEVHLQRHRDRLSKGHKVLVVAHSQGNLYANESYTRLFSSSRQGAESVRLVGVASPTSFIAGAHASLCARRGCYTTFDTDAVIELVRRFFSDTLEPNVRGVVDLPPADLLAHGLVDAYLYHDDSRRQIGAQMRAQVDALVTPEASLPDGVLSASLEWSAAADLDLHVYEQDERAHVAYFNPAGRVGTLDRDDRDGPQGEDGVGRENYHAECAALKAGLYRFDASYYDGAGPATATLQLTVGTTTRTFRKRFDAPTEDPRPLATVDIVELADDRYVFVVTAGAGAEEL